MAVQEDKAALEAKEAREVTPLAEQWGIPLHHLEVIPSPSTTGTQPQARPQSTPGIARPVAVPSQRMEASALLTATNSAITSGLLKRCSEPMSER